jgi:hypothetical protein
MKLEDFVQEDKANKKFFEETILPAVDEVLDVLRKHGLCVQDSAKVINCVNDKLKKIATSTKV